MTEITENSDDKDAQLEDKIYDEETLNDAAELAINEAADWNHLKSLLLDWGAYSNHKITGNEWQGIRDRWTTERTPPANESQHPPIDH